MSKSIYIRPNSYCFITDGVRYGIIESSPEESVSSMILSFSIGYTTEDSEQAHQSITIAVCPIRTSEGDTAEVDVADIVATFTKRLWVDEAIYGHATIQLTEIDGVEVSDLAHICFFGTAGGLNMAAELPATHHPFLTARGNDNGALHFYRSELLAMEYIYVLYPFVYDSMAITTDNGNATNHDYAGLIYSGNSFEHLLAIHYYEGDATHPYDITTANSIYIHLTPGDEANPKPESRMYAIAVQNDPDTDELHILRWTNSMGAPDALLFTGELQDISEIDTSELYITESNLKSVSRKKMRGMITSKYMLHTGYLTPARTLALLDMIISDEVEMLNNGEWIPVNVTADMKRAVHQREPKSFELTIEVLEQTKYFKPNREIIPIQENSSQLLQDNRGNVIVDNNSDTIY
ncbi:MAG: hypothetical protein II825_11350 [Paludibacteraceae bacterium]|nr:hypothetical protein [Paludibacteraceae bacterium]MBQ6777370.1 hypothetical protein [Paludibacteraceae bacterium]